MKDRKLLFLGGKGGVGKTTLSCAFALLFVKRNYRTLLISTDPAHSVPDLLGDEEGELNYLCIDAKELAKDYVKSALRSVEPLVSPETFRDIREVFHAVEHTPGTEEAVIVDALSRIITERWNDYARFVVDTAPTGHTLTMLRTVGRLGKWIEELLERKSKARRLTKAAGVEGTDESILRILRDRRERFFRFAEILSSQKSAFIPVLVPEKLPIEETKRLYRELTSMGMNVDILIVNKIMPPNPKDPFFASRKEQEKNYLREIRESFPRTKIVEISMRERDVRDRADLLDLSRELEEKLWYHNKI